MKIPEKQWLTRNEAYSILHQANFLYKGRTITIRTIRTLIENGTLKNVVKSKERRCDLIKGSDVYKLIQK